MAKKKFSHIQKSSSKRLKVLPAWAVPEMESAISDLERGNWNAARKTLEYIDARCPRRPEVLALLAIAYEEQGENGRLLRICRQMREISPNDPDILAMSVHSYQLNYYPVLALQALDKLLAEYPYHDAITGLREARDGIRNSAEILLTGAGLSLDDMESAVLHEESGVLFGEGRLKEAQKVTARLLERLPRFSPALNNLSQLQWLEGQKQKAVATAERVLEQDPDNVHALSNLVRYCFLSGREAEAHEWARQLIASTAEGFDAGFKKAEALSYLGEDEALVALYKDAQAQKLEQSPGSDAAMGHMAAVAAWRLGREAEAKKWWKKWQYDEESMLGETLRENLDDLKKPVGERDGPWALPFTSWLDKALVDDILKRSTANGSRVQSPAQDQSSMRRISKKFLADHPELDTLIPAFLDRGEPKCREFALMLCDMARTPKCLESLRDFALGQRGSDSSRMRAAQILREENALNSGKSGLVRLWQKGEWRELLLMAFELHGEPDLRFSPADSDLVTEAHHALEQGNPVMAETIYRRLLADFPNDPTLSFNLAQALAFQHKDSESEELIREVHKTHPDYLHARIAVVRQIIAEGDLERAEELIQPIFDIQRLHFSEYALLAVAEIELLLAQDKPEGAESWLKLFRDVLPDHPAIPTLKRQIARAGLKPKKRK